MPSLKTYLGHVLAPWPFVIFALSALVGGAIVCPLLGMARGIMVAFDAASIAFIASCAPLFRHNAQQMRQTASQNDANRGFLLLTAAAVTGVILISVAIELSQKGRPHPVDLRLVVVTLCSLLVVQHACVRPSLRASLLHARDQGSGRGLSFPATKEPDYWDFAYFSSCLAMTFQTSDVEISSRRIRRTSMFHSIGAFVFNIGVSAFSINILGSS